MMNFAKRILAFFLLGIFLFNTMGYFIAFKAMQYEIKSNIISQIKLGVPTADETVLTIAKSDLKNIDWKEQGKEMVYNGKRYDVIKKQEDAMSVTFYCINDKQEETLFANLDNQINSHIASQKSSSKGAAKNMVNDIVKIVFNQTSSFSYYLEATSSRCFLPYEVSFTSETLQTSSPPPRIG